MLQDHLSTNHHSIQTPHEDADLLRLRSAGKQAAKSFVLLPPRRGACEELKQRIRRAAQIIERQFKRKSADIPDAQWLFENHRLILTAVKDSTELPASLAESRVVAPESAAPAEPVASAVARAYLRAALDLFSPEGLESFIGGFQEICTLEMGELWAVKPALELVIVERIAEELEGVCSALPALITSLRYVGEANWKDLFEAASITNAVLSDDPSGHFRQMDYESRDLYRNTIAHLAKHSDLTEQQVAEKAIQLSSEASWDRRRHVGYWLLDRGLPELKSAIGYRGSIRQRIRDLVLAWPQTYYLIGIELLTLIVAFSILEERGPLTPTLLALALVLLPVTQAVVDFMNNLTTWLVRPRILPKLDFSDGIPAEFATLVAVPTLLLNEKQVRQLVSDLEVRYLANRDPNLRFALVTDGPDSLTRTDQRDDLVDVCIGLIDHLNRRYAFDRRGENDPGSSSTSGPFYLFHRHRIFNPSEGRWMGWERKRGKLLDLNHLMRGGYDSFPIKVGDLTVLRGIRYIITLDSDSQLPRDAARRLVGTIAHPLHRAVVDPATKMVVAGYGILQPRIAISIDSAASSRLANIYSGQTGFDIYTRAVSDVYQDLFGEGIFTGKGIYDIDALDESLDERFPENALLSHDLIEGAYARAGLVTDVELIDDYPSHFSAYSRRKHRWVRGDWQIMRWVLPRVPDYHGRIIPNPLSLISRWKIIDNLRRSLLEPATLALFLAGWFVLPSQPQFWTLTSIAMLLIPAYAGLLFALPGAPRRLALLRPWLKETARTFLQAHVVVLLQIVFLLHQAMLSLDAIGRSVLRVLVIRKRLLEWETAAEAENAQHRTATVDLYLAWSPLIAAAIAGLLYLVRPEALPVAAPILFLWFIARFLSAWLNRAPGDYNRELHDKDVRFLRASAVRTWRFFREHSGANTNWLIPDNVRETGEIAARLSPTNLGLLLNARLSAVHFGYLTVPEFIEQTSATLGVLRNLVKYRGHVLNWYCTDTVRCLEPRFVSTVDSGNLAVCLWTLKQGALALAAKPPSEDSLHAGIEDIKAQADEEQQNGAETFWANELAERRRMMETWLERSVTAAPELRNSLHEIAAECDRIVNEMDFGFLWNRRRKVLSIGCDVETGQSDPSVYDLLASESRMASFVAIAKGEIPQESWFHLGRSLTLYGGDRVLVSWTGTMFEYLMPRLWMKHYRETILYRSVEAAVRVQQHAVRRWRVPWGISESACISAQGTNEYGYHAFGIPELAMKASEDSDYAVISPYSTFLALSVDPRGSLRNLRRMKNLGWFGRYGFYEAVDYRVSARSADVKARDRKESAIVRSWMAHHQGMSLLAIDNLLFNDRFQTYFHAEPGVQATELLLHERVPAAIAAEAMTKVAIPPAADHASASAS